MCFKQRFSSDERHKFLNSSWRSGSGKGLLYLSMRTVRHRTGRLVLLMFVLFNQA